MDEIVTTDLGDFGWRELSLASELLNAMTKNDLPGLPEEFEFNHVQIALNKRSGYVFLTNAEYQVAMMNGDKLEMYYTCPICGAEGFTDEIKWNEEKDLCGLCAAAGDEDDDDLDGLDKPISQMTLGEIDDYTGFVRGDKFTSEKQVQEYFTVENMVDMFGICILTQE